MRNTTDLETANKARNTAQTELANSEEIFKLLVDAVDEYAIFALDASGVILTWNAGGVRLKGYQPGEVIGSHFSRFYTQVDIERHHPEFELKEAAAKGKYEEEGWRVKKDGSIFWANVVITALRDSRGVLRGFGKVTRDLTHKRAAELAIKESEERFRLLVANVTDYAIINLDIEGKIASWNAGAERIKGFKEKDIIGRHFSAFYPKSEVEFGKPEMELRIATDEGRYEEEGWRVRKDGTMFWASVTITSMRDETGTLRGFAKVTRDLTERKKAEDELRRAYADLEVRISERTKELSVAKEKAEDAVKTRDQFFSMASHELKTPLSSMKLQTQFRKRNIKKGRLQEFAPENLLALCEEDERQVERLTFLVDNMLDISRLTSGQFKLTTEPFNLKDMVMDVINRMDPILKQSGNQCNLTVHDEIIGTWDRIRLEQVLINLLANTAKYAAGKSVEVNLALEGARAQIIVKDHGRGISEKDRQRIFDSFERVNDDGKTSGLGLGLFISKQIIEAHRGTIKVESEPGAGTIFTIDIPLNAALPDGNA